MWRYSGAYRRTKPTTTVRSPAAAAMAAHSSMVMPVGFSQNTCLPAARAATICSRWRSLRLPISTQSTYGSSSMAV